MKSATFHTSTPEETMVLGEHVARCCRGGEIICLSGDLGSGKTTFVKGMAQGLQLNPRSVNSPTFVIMNMYEGRLPLYHFDFYRLEKSQDIAGVGYDEFLYGEGVAVIEWAERFGPLMPPEHVAIQIRSTGELQRDICISAHGDRYQDFILKLQRATTHQKRIRA